MTLDAYNGKLDTVATAPIRRADFVVDATGQVRFALGAGEDNASKLYHRATSDAPWTLINDENTTQRVEVPRGFAPDGRTAYLQVEQREGPDAIVALDTVTGERTQVLRDADRRSLPDHPRPGRSHAGGQLLHARQAAHGVLR